MDSQSCTWKRELSALTLAHHHAHRRNNFKLHTDISFAKHAAELEKMDQKRFAQTNQKRCIGKNTMQIEIWDIWNACKTKVSLQYYVALCVLWETSGEHNVQGTRIATLRSLRPMYSSNTRPWISSIFTHRTLFADAPRYLLFSLKVKVCFSTQITQTGITQCEPYKLRYSHFLSRSETGYEFHFLCLLRIIEWTELPKIVCENNVLIYCPQWFVWRTNNVVVWRLGP